LNSNRFLHVRSGRGWPLRLFKSGLNSNRFLHVRSGRGFAVAPSERLSPAAPPASLAKAVLFAAGTTAEFEFEHQISSREAKPSAAA